MYQNLRFWRIQGRIIIFSFYSMGTIQPAKIIMKTLEINRYTYDLINLIPHTSAQYRIFCYCDEVEVKYITGLLEGEQYKEWTNDDWLDIFIREKVESL